MMTEINEIDYKQLHTQAVEEIKELKMNLKVQKRCICDMLEAEILMKQRHADEVVILKKLIEEEKYERDCKVTSLREQIRELKDNLEYKETFMQTKEKKWSDVEKIFVEYAKEDEDLQNKLDELNYI